MEQNRLFEMEKNYLENEYNKIIQAYIIKERQKVSDSNFNRQISELRNRGNITSLNLKDNNKKF